MPEATTKGEGSPGGDRPKGLTVLVVDDDPAVRKVASKALRRVGYDVVEARGGAEAIELTRAYDGRIDLLLTDVVMPGMNGRELSERLRAARPDLPVLFMSAHAEDEVFLHGVRVSLMDFLPKPFSLEQLVETVNQLVGRPPS